MRARDPDTDPLANDEPDPPSIRATTSIPPPPSSLVAGSFFSRRRFAGFAIGLAMIGAAGSWVHLRGAKATVTTPTAQAPVVASSAPAPVPVPEGPRADADFEREGRSYCAGGPMFVLPDFASADGKFDLVVHLHGASDLVSQSFAVNELNAVVVVFNLGVGSGVYEQFFGYKPRFSQMIELAEAEMAKRKLKNPKVRRIALSAFSAGFGGVVRMLERATSENDVDAVLLFDGIHGTYDDHHELDLHNLDPLLDFARAATRGEKLFYLTHSDIPTLDYASTHETTDALLKMFGVARQPGGESPKMPDLVALGPPGARRTLPVLEPSSHAEKNGFFVRGFTGDKAEHHRSHLHQMATTGVPHLASRWASVPSR